MAAGGAAGRRGPGQRSSLVGSCGAVSSGWCAERFSVPRAVRPSHLLRRPGPVRACVSAPAPGAAARRGEPPPQVRGRRGSMGGMERVSRNVSEGPESSTAGSESSDRAVYLGWIPGGWPPTPPAAQSCPVPGRHWAGAANGSGAHRERVSARRGGVAPEREMWGLGWRWGARSCKALQSLESWEPRGDLETREKREGWRSFAWGRRGPKAA